MNEKTSLFPTYCEGVPTTSRVKQMDMRFHWRHGCRNQRHRSRTEANGDGVIDRDSSAYFGAVREKGISGSELSTALCSQEGVSTDRGAIECRGNLKRRRGNLLC